MKTFDLHGDEEKPDSFENHVIQNAMGIPRILDSAATTANGIVPEGFMGYFNNKLYITIGGTTYRADLTAV